MTTPRTTQSKVEARSGFTAIATILAVIGGLAAIFTPMQARLAVLEVKVALAEEWKHSSTKELAGKEATHSEAIKAHDRLLQMLWDRVFALELPDKKK